MFGSESSQEKKQSNLLYGFLIIAVLYITVRTFIG